MYESPPETALASRPLHASDPVAVLEQLRDRGGAWLLESALRDPRLGHHSYVGADPYAILRIRGPVAELECLRAVHEGLAPGRTRFGARGLEALRRALPKAPGTRAPVPFAGGAVGYLGYELASGFDAHAFHGHDDLGLPDAVLLLVDSVVGFDHRSGACWISGLGMGSAPDAARRRAERAADALAARLETPRACRRRRPWRASAPAGCGLDPDLHAKAVHEIRDEIAAGNVYQACLTQRTSQPFAADPWNLYLALREINPAPFASFLELPEVAIVGSSPERFLAVTPEGRAESRPIKGTAPRGRHPAEDARRRDALARSEKDRAENLMIVDLVRNDLGRVCDTGSVHVPELRAIEAYASVFQMVSTVRGRLAAGRDAIDLVAATFPPGSMTGAPKIAAMRLLDRLEPARRGIYSGALGYFDAGGGADLSVVIRTALVADGRVYLHAGGGIVADSDAAAEYREALDKLRPLLLALDAVARREPAAEVVGVPASWRRWAGR